MIYKNQIKIKNKGYITLMSVLVVGAVGVSISVSLLLLGIGSSRSSLAYQQLHQAKALANACAEEGLQQIRNVTAYVGTGGLSLGAGTCTYTVASQGGSNRTITATGTVGGVIRRVSVAISAINPLIVATSWQEVP